jgi:hypothetical protein
MCSTTSIHTFVIKVITNIQKPTSICSLFITLSSNKELKIYIVRVVTMFKYMRLYYLLT